jgi:phosphatidate cytidylyltransferase
MHKMVQRLLIFFIGLPLVIVMVYFLPHYHHLVLNLAVILFSALGALEFAAMLENKQLFVSRGEALVLGALLPAAETLVLACTGAPGSAALIPAAFLAAGVFRTLAAGACSRAAALDGFISRLGAGFAVMLYPGMLLSWLVKMSGWEHSEIIISVFLLTAMGNDSAAWAAGMLFGKGNQGVVPASPNKSVAGFIGGTIASMSVGAGAALLLPAVFVPRFESAAVLSSPLAAGILLGLFSGAAAALGDLAESAIKRSSGSKDSGRIMLGRGGVLDSIDSIALAAPVFYLVFSLLFKQS